MRSLGPFRKIGQRRKFEGRAADRHEVESDRDRMAGADDLALDAEIAAQPDTQAIGQHHQPRRDHFAVGQRELLPFRAGRDIGHLGVDEFGGGWDFGANRADQRVIHDAVLAARLLVEQVAESRDPVFAVMGGRAKHRIGDSGLVKAIELLVAADFFDAEVEWIGLMRIDQDGWNPRASEHGGRGRAGKAAADDRDVGILHGESRPRIASFAPRMANKCLAGKNWNRKMLFLDIFTRV